MKTKTNATKKYASHVRAVRALNADFTPDELKVIYRVLQSTWSEIGYDVLSASGDGESALMPQDEVIEVVLDADHTERHVEREDEAVWARYKTLPYDMMCEIAKGTFKHKHYGM